jgi:opacity protein-like surface antigen
MKKYIRLLGLGLLLFWQPRFLTAQTENPKCHDIVRLQNGSIFRGKIEAVKGEGQTVVFRTWSGIVFELHHAQIRRITQRCKENNPLFNRFKPYDFKENGWYHNTRVGLLVGQAYYGVNRVGFQLQHSSGWMFKRQIGLGLGAGVEYFDPKGNDAATYPVFAEVRSYLLAKNTTPYLTLGGGWAFTGNHTGDRSNVEDNWKGGWLAQAEIGYRIGNNFTVHAGIRLQHKKREWTSNWGWGSETEGVDRILHKRLILGIGVLL